MSQALQVSMKDRPMERVSGPRSVLTAATDGGNTESSLRGPSSVLSWRERVPPRCLIAHVFLGFSTKSFLLLLAHLKMYFYRRTEQMTGGNPLVSCHPLLYPPPPPQVTVHFLFLFCFAHSFLTPPSYQLIPPCIEPSIKKLS